MIDLHTHSLFSDGELIPAELIRRAVSIGYRVIAITDHGDSSNLDFIVPRLTSICQRLSALMGIKAIGGIELTHVPPAMIAELTKAAREMGAGIVVAHGETIVEPVAPGTNRAAIEAGVDILAHPGLLTDDEAALAARRGVRLELSARKGHSLTNGHVLNLARRHGAKLLINTDAHAPGDLITREMALLVAQGAGMTRQEAEAVLVDAEAFVRDLSPL